VEALRGGSERLSPRVRKFAGAAAWNCGNLQLVRESSPHPMVDVLMRLSQWSAAAVPLFSCIALIVACATAPPKSAEQAQGDEIRAQRVYAALNADPIYCFRHVDVRVDKGVAYPRRLRLEYAGDLPRRIAAAVPGVDHVVNAMELERQGTRGGSGSG
jgi:hypothetical protein